MVWLAFLELLLKHQTHPDFILFSFLLPGPTYKMFFLKQVFGNIPENV